MISLGQSIRIFLADGTVTGIRHAEVVNWTGQAVACPRSRIGELAGWDETARPGVYLLLGHSEEDDRPAVYIGEAENVRDRLQDHIAKKEFWNEVILFTNKDENLTKAHVRFLESKLVEIAVSTKRYKVINATAPTAALLPRGDRDAMESFLGQIRVLLGVLGHRVLEPIASTAVAAAKANQGESTAVAVGGSLAGTQLRLQTKSVQATGMLTDEGVVVFAGSKAAAKAAESIGGTYKRLRDELLAKGVLIPSGDLLQFAQDFLFSSPTAAAVAVVGYAVNGRDAWKTAAGVTVNALEGAGASGAADTASVAL